MLLDVFQPFIMVPFNVGKFHLSLAEARFRIPAIQRVRLYALVPSYTIPMIVGDERSYRM